MVRSVAAWHDQTNSRYSARSPKDDRNLVSFGDIACQPCSLSKRSFRTDVQGTVCQAGQETLKRIYTIYRSIR